MSLPINMWGDREVTDLQGALTTEKPLPRHCGCNTHRRCCFSTKAVVWCLRINGYFAPHKFAVALDFVAGRHERKAASRISSPQRHRRPRT